MFLLHLGGVPVTGKPRALLIMQYPGIESQLNALSAQLDCTCERLVISTIAASGYVELVKKLRREKYDRLYILIADDTLKSLASILILLSMMVPARERYLLYMDRTAVGVSYLDGASAALKMVVSFGVGLYRLMALRLRVTSLLRKERVRVSSRIGDFQRRICYFRTDLWLGIQAGGALSHTRGVINAAARKGWHITYFSADTQAKWRETKNIDLVLCHPRNVYVIPRELNQVSYNYDFLPFAEKAVAKRPGIIYQRTSIANFCGVEMSRRHQLPLIVEYNGSEGWLSRNWGTPFLFSGTVDDVETLTLQHAHMVVTVSEPLREELRLRGVPDERIFVHANGVDLDQFSPTRFTDADRIGLRSSCGIPEDAVVVSFVGTFGPWHGAEVLADAITQLLRDVDEDDLYFIFIGDGVRRQSVEQSLAPFIEKNRVTITGLVPPENVPQFLFASDILVAPTVVNPDKSTFFGSPTKLFEYMASTRVVIASGLGQVSDVLAGSVSAHEIAGLSKSTIASGCGILIRPGKVDDLVTAIKFAKEHPELRAALGANARERVAEKYTWEAHVSACFDRLGRILASDAQPRVCVLINALHSKSGGGITYLKNILPYISKEPRIETHVCIHRDQRRLFEDVLENVTVHEFGFKQGFWRLLLREQFSVPWLAHKIKADVVFSPANYGPLFAKNAVLLLRNSLAVAFVERRFGKLLYWGLLYIATAASMFRAKRIIAVSRYASTVGIGTLGPLSRGCDIIPHGVSSIFKSDPSLGRSDHELLVVADIYVQKNLHTLVDALPSIVARFPDVILRIAGAEIDSYYAKKLKAKVYAHGLSDKVIFEGSVDSQRLISLYNTCAVFVFPSTVETFGNPLVEAMSCGVPIACSNTSAMPEIAGEAVVYFDPHSPLSIEQTVCELLGDKAKRDELRRKALARSTAFSWENTARRMIEVLIDAGR